MYDDFIRRQSAIDAIDACYDGVAEDDYDYGLQDGVNRARFIIEDLPAAYPEPQWIPCSSGQMPDDLAEVNITWVNRDPEPYYAFLKDKPFTASAVYYKGIWHWYSATCVDYLNEYGNSPADEMDDAIKVIAWKPLPEPWKDGD